MWKKEEKGLAFLPVVIFDTLGTMAILVLFGRGKRKGQVLPLIHCCAEE